MPNSYLTIVIVYHLVQKSVVGILVPIPISPAFISLNNIFFFLSFKIHMLFYLCFVCGVWQIIVCPFSFCRFVSCSSWITPDYTCDVSDYTCDIFKHFLVVPLTPWSFDTFQKDTTVLNWWSKINNKQINVFNNDETCQKIVHLVKTFITTISYQKQQLKHTHTNIIHTRRIE